LVSACLGNIAAASIRKFCGGHASSSAPCSSNNPPIPRLPGNKPRSTRLRRSADKDMASAIVFAYHEVGVRCLKVLLAQGVQVPLLVTHRDNPAENIWFESVAAVARTYGIPTITPDDPNLPDTVERVAGLDPDFLFSFYFRHMMGSRLLAAGKYGALNMHGSLLPKYRGRVPVNWAVINGEAETGATLHYMVEKPDAGDIVDREKVSINFTDTAFDVFNRLTGAAVAVITRSWPLLLAGTACRVPMDLKAGSYFGGRKPADGLID